jgi:type I restriction enzyme S subunit
MFEVKNENELSPEYLMMWFSREEFDREAAYYAVGGVRGNLPWNNFLEMKIPVPSIAVQRDIVAQYNAIQNRINQNNALIARLEQTAQAIYKEWFVDGVDKHWGIKKLGNVCEIKAGGDKPKTFSETKTKKCFVPIYSNGVTNDGLYGFTDKANYPKNSITISARGTIGFSVLRRENFDAIVRLLVLIPKISNSAIYLWQAIKQVEFDVSGSVQNQLTVPQLSVIDILIPEQRVLDKYNSIVEILFNQIELKNQESQKLEQLKSLLLSKLTIKK